MHSGHPHWKPIPCPQSALGQKFKALHEQSVSAVVGLPRWFNTSLLLYCATIALGRYSSHSGKIHYIQDADLSLYMRHHLWRTLAIYPSGLVTPSIHLLPADFASVRTEPLMGHTLGSSTSAFIYQACTLKGVARPCGS